MKKLITLFIVVTLIVLAIYGILYLVVTYTWAFIAWAIMLFITIVIVVYNLIKDK